MRLLSPDAHVVILPYVVGSITEIASWPEDNVRVGEVGQESNRKKSSSRLQMVEDFGQRRPIRKNLPIGFIGSVPRWKLSRILDKNKTDGG